MNLNRILMIDDSEAEQFLYQIILKEHFPDIKITPAYDGVEALDIISKQDEGFDCILLDINMPRMNGFEFLEQYAKSPKSNDNIVIMLTSSIQPKDKEKALSYPFVKSFFMKPIDINDLKQLEIIASS